MKFKLIYWTISLDMLNKNTFINLYFFSSSGNVCQSKQDGFQNINSSKKSSKPNGNETFIYIIKKVCFLLLTFFIILYSLDYFFNKCIVCQFSYDFKSNVMSCFNKNLLLLITQKSKIPPPM